MRLPIGWFFKFVNCDYFETFDFELVNQIHVFYCFGISSSPTQGLIDLLATPHQWKIWYFAANYRGRRRHRHFFEAIVLCIAFHRSILIGEAERTEVTKMLICRTGFATAADSIQSSKFGARTKSTPDRQTSLLE